MTNRNPTACHVDCKGMDALGPVLSWHAHAVTALLVHLVWSTRRRAPWLEPRVDRWLADVLEHKARHIQCAVLAVGNAYDHVHVLVRHPPSVAVSLIAQRLKGASSRALHREVSGSDGLVWQVGYWAESVGPRELEPLIQYVRNQRTHHREGSPREPWEAPR